MRIYVNVCVYHCANPPSYSWVCLIRKWLADYPVLKTLSVPASSAPSDNIFANNTWCALMPHEVIVFFGEHFDQGQLGVAAAISVNQCTTMLLPVCAWCRCGAHNKHGGEAFSSFTDKQWESYGSTMVNNQMVPCPSPLPQSDRRRLLATTGGEP